MHAEDDQPSEASAGREAAEVARMVAFLQANRRRYSLLALRARLVAQGHDPMLVARAAAQLPPDTETPSRAWSLVGASATLNLLLLSAWVVALNPFAPGNFWLWGGITLAEVAALVALWFVPRVRDGVRFWGQGLLLATALVGGITLLLVGIGVCAISIV